MVYNHCAITHSGFQHKIAVSMSASEKQYVINTGFRHKIAVSMSASEMRYVITAWLSAKKLP